MPLSRLQQITGDDRTLATRSAMLFLQKLGDLKKMIEQAAQPNDLAKIRSCIRKLSSDLVLFEKEPLIQHLSSILNVGQDQDGNPVSPVKKEAVCREIEACMTEVTEMLQTENQKN